MEDIEDLLELNERIIWYRTQNVNYLKNKQISIFWVIIQGVITLLYLIFSFFMEFFLGFSFLIYAFYIVMVIFNAFCIIGENKEINNYGLEKKELKNYKKIFALTNNRWIQKDCEFNSRIDHSNFPEGSIIQKRDVIILSLVHIQAFVVEKTRKKYNIGISTGKELSGEILIGVNLSKEEHYEKFIKSIIALIPLKKRIEELGYLIYYRDDKKIIKSEKNYIKSQKKKLGKKEIISNIRKEYKAKLIQRKSALILEWSHNYPEIFVELIGDRIQGEFELPKHFDRRIFEKGYFFHQNNKLIIRIKIKN